jgi:hypothetical protein
LATLTEFVCLLQGILLTADLQTDVLPSQRSRANKPRGHRLKSEEAEADLGVDRHITRRDFVMVRF